MQRREGPTHFEHLASDLDPQCLRRKWLQPRCSSARCSKSIGPEGLSYRSRVSGAGSLGGPRVAAPLLEVASATMLFSRSRQKASGLKASPTGAGRVARAPWAVLASLLRCRKWLQPRCSSPRRSKRIGPEVLSYQSQAAGHPASRTFNCALGLSFLAASRLDSD